MPCFYSNLKMKARYLRARLRTPGCMDLLDLWILDTTVLPKHDVLPFLQLREDSLLVTIGDAA